jgi:hypothetical protein
LNQRWWSGLRALVNGAFVLLTQRAFALLLALLFDDGLRSRWRLLSKCKHRKARESGGGAMGFNENEHRSSESSETERIFQRAAK